MQIDAKVIEVLPLQTGEGKNGPWKKQDVVVMTKGPYPKKICIGFWNDKIVNSILQTGYDVRIYFDIESRDYNGKWYTEAKGWKVALVLGDGPSVISDVNSGNEGEDDLPF